VIIDPLIDGITGFETAATRTMNRQLVEIAAGSFPRIKVLPLTVENLDRAKFLVIGTFNPINNAGDAAGPRDAYWLCFVAIDLAKKVVAARTVNRALPAGVDSTPAPMFARSPIWSLDQATLAYIRACQRSKRGDPVDAAYLSNLRLRVANQEGQAALEAGRYDEALAQFAAAAALPGGQDSVATYNGLYLAMADRGLAPEALQAITRLIDIGLKQDRLGILFLFQTASTAFVDDAALSSRYPDWIAALGQRAAEAGRCLEVVGHASRTGSEAANVRLSRGRADAIVGQLERASPRLTGHLAASGRGSSEVLVGLPVDDAQTAIDKRVEIRPIPCGSGRG
jgi:outer membrane protein OmpA-like peptidoglycan-associated protein